MLVIVACISVKHDTVYKSETGLDVQNRSLYNELDELVTYILQQLTSIFVLVIRYTRYEKIP